MDVVDSRQVLHVGYGAILDEFGPQLYKLWNDHEEELYGVVADHFVKHLQPFAPHARVARCTPNCAVVAHLRCPEWWTAAQLP